LWRNDNQKKEEKEGDGARHCDISAGLHIAMKKERVPGIVRVVLVCVLLMSQCLAPSPLMADFEELGWSAASGGMADAAMFSKKIPSLFYINPAASSYFEEPVIGMEYEKMYPGLSDGSGLTRNIFTYTQKLEGAGCGAGFEKFSLDNLYSESTYIINYSKSLSNNSPKGLSTSVSGSSPKGLSTNTRGKWFIGGNLRILQKHYGSDDYTLNAVNSDGSAPGAADPLFVGNGFDKTAFTLDAGLTRNFIDAWSLSSAVSFLTSPDTSLGGGYKRKPSLSVGAVYETGSLTVGETLRFSGGDYRADTGFERRLDNETLKVRGGLSTGSGELKLLSMGLGYLHLKKVSIDYAFIYPLSGIKDSGGRHRVSASFIFGGGKVKFSEEASHAQTAVSAEKTDIDKLLERARGALLEEQWRDAAALSRKVLIQEPDNIAALEIFAEASEKLKILFEPLVREGNRLVSAGRFAEAEAKYNEALDINPYDEAVRGLCDKIKNITAVMPQALGASKISHLIRAAVRAYLSNDSALAVNASVYVSQIDKSIVSGNIRNIVKDEFSAKYRELRLIKGMNLVEQKLYSALKNIYNARYDLAIIECNEVLDLEPENVLALTRLGSAYYALGKKAKGIEVWKEALKYDPDNKDIREFIEMPRDSSIKEVYKTRQSVAEGAARRDAGALIKIKKLYLNGAAAVKRKEYDKAKLLFKEASEVPGAGAEEDKYRQKAADSLKKTRRLIEKANKDKRRRMKAHYSAGMSYYKNGLYAKSVSEFKKLLIIKPGHKQALKMIDLCRQKMEK